jgi:hypothetical protein
MVLTEGPPKPKRKIQNPENITPGVPKFRWKVQCLPYVSEYMKIPDLNKNRYCGVLDGAKHDSETTIKTKWRTQ